jgi:hypothetical protein
MDTFAHFFFSHVGIKTRNSIVTHHQFSGIAIIIAGLNADDPSLFIRTPIQNCGITFYSIISGEIIAKNDAVESDATVLNRSPYKQGWIVCIKPSDYDGDSGELVMGDDAISGFDAYMAEKEMGECIHCEGFEG